MLMYLLGTLFQDAHQPFKEPFLLCCSLGGSCICTTDEGDVPLICFQTRVSVLFYSKVLFLKYRKGCSLACVNTGLERLDVVRVSF